jgi:hypothetical protein
LVLAALLIAAVASPVAATQSHQQRAFVAVLKGGNEVPPVETDGFGFAALGVSQTDTALGFVLSAFRLESVIQAHIHCGAEGVNGPVVAFLFGPADPPVTKNIIFSKGVITDANVLPRPDSPQCPGGVANLAQLLEKMRAGEAYVNVHTSANTGGEIRGQIK